MTADSETAHGKLNLALHVRRREADGYHAIETLFAFTEAGDRLALDDRPGLTIEGPFAAALAGEGDNLILRAARAFAEAFAIDRPTGIRLDKRLPIAAGIGGGSADAAATLRLLCRRYGIGADRPEVAGIARALGADVPACLASIAAHGSGRGDRLVAIARDRFAGSPVLLVNPGQPLATGAVFAGWDGVDRGPLDPADPIGGRNDLEPAARALVPAIGEILAQLSRRDGVTMARMSGSGATCFALFDTPAARDAADAAIAGARPGWWRLATRLR